MMNGSIEMPVDPDNAFYNLIINDHFIVIINFRSS